MSCFYIRGLTKRREKNCSNKEILGSIKISSNFLIKFIINYLNIILVKRKKLLIVVGLKKKL